jgi:4-amino-4-deoxy-L-arabinose transferase-like glycosyltransferase
VTRDTPPCERAYRRTLALLTIAVALWTTAWAVLTPGFRSPDEQNHLNSVVRVAYGGGWPAPGEAHFAPVTVQAVAEAAYPADLPGRWTYRDHATQFVDLTPIPADQRAQISAENALPAQGTSATVDQMTQHPPAYYALGAAVLHATGTVDARWDHALLALRLLDVVLFAASVPLAAAAARRLTGSRSAALVAAPLPMLVPQVGHIMGSANNDALVVLSGAGVVYLAARVVTGDQRWRTAVVLGIVLGVGLLTKVMPAFAIPTVVAAYLLAPGPHRSPRAGPTAWVRSVRAFVALAVAFVVGGWWWARNWIVDGAVQPVGLPRDYTGMTPVPADQVLSDAVGRTAQAFFGNLSWLEIHLPGFLVVTGSVVLAVAGLVAVVVPGARRGAVTLALLPAGLYGGVVFNAVRNWNETGVLVALQGRYVFGGLAALAVLVAIAVWHACRHRESRLARAVPVVAGLATLAAVASLVWAFGAMYRGPGETVAEAWERWAAWSPLGGTTLAVILLVVAAGLGAALAAALRWAQVPDPGADAPGSSGGAAEGTAEARRLVGQNLGER